MSAHPAEARQKWGAAKTTASRAASRNGRRSKKRGRKAEAGIIDVRSMSLEELVGVKRQVDGKLKELKGMLDKVGV